MSLLRPLYVSPSRTWSFESNFTASNICIFFGHAFGAFLLEVFYISAYSGNIYIDNRDNHA